MQSAPSSIDHVPRAKLAWLPRLVGTVGAWIIYRLIAIFGRTHEHAHVAWLIGPMGGARIGDAPYREVAAAEGLTVERHAKDGGLVPDVNALARPDFDPASLHPLIREFYEHTARFAMDVWSKTYFPSNVALWLLVKTICRQVNQLNFPLSPLDTAHGMSSEIITLRDGGGRVRYSGWFRTVGEQGTVLYTGFYMTEQAPNETGRSVKVVFPMPHGNATVILRPSADQYGALILDSSGKRFGDPGFYRLDARGADRVRAWHIKSLKEHFRVYVDDRGVLRCDHSVRFLWMNVLRLHYKIFKR